MSTNLMWGLIIIVERATRFYIFLIFVHVRDLLRKWDPVHNRRGGLKHNSFMN